MADYIVGLTGGIGSGKTTVANLFAELGITLVDADVIARDVVMKGSYGLAQITQHFGDDILLDDGNLDRAKLREKIFHNDAERVWLNSLLHPLIRETMLKQCKQAQSNYVIMVVPLLFENGLDSLVDRTLLVDISPELQQQRTMSRDSVTAQQVKNIISSQATRAEKLSKADDVIDNQGEISALKCKVEALHNFYLKLSSNS
ncbi:dephospho-CoA kinase [Shewanella schlegeliana]|uniref:Dephospho-CoA kinase n=1 Tax=Shewanella schlegeliana TaxID=190308 RepID=A0ABS1T5M5_9GAMM|nr:dephospho-CoA kinase [Shewanella schlegeliana]MBL4914796.1 dephospho-CoA kinase [Shewanella schlegeliana]MCL1110513.1 dephospho-CoA kinase [Shewanella schlegeliana]GIU27335.1 dephospho-CoA kinase [Shewanella schlegeliana]